MSEQFCKVRRKTYKNIVSSKYIINNKYKKCVI